MSKKYVCIVKVGADRFVKYRLNDLLKFVSFLDTKWQGWRWFNVYDKRTKQQIGNFTNQRRPVDSTIAAPE